jgi:hypothetical protein
VAGFDATFTFDPRHADLLAAIITAARRRARPMSVRWRSRVDADSGVGWVGIDGNTFQLDVYLHRLRRDLPTIAEAVASGGRPAWRRKYALGLVDVLTRFRCDFYERYGMDHVPRLRAVSKPAVMSVHSLWMGERHRDLWARLAVTEEIMGEWLLDEVPPEVVVEELHTAAELLLTRWARKSRAPAFAVLVDLAGAAEILPPLELLRFQYVDPADALAGLDLLIALKDLRRDLKHRGVGNARPWLVTHFWAVGSVLERLARAVAERPRPRPATIAPTRV